MGEKREFSKPTVLTIRTTPDVKDLLADLAELDGRTATREAEFLIRQEHKRRWSEIEAHYEWKRKAAGLRKP